MQHDDLHITVGHTHPADAAAVDAGVLKEKMRMKMTAVRAQPGAVLTAAVHSAPTDVRVALGRQNDIKRTLRRLVLPM